MTFVLLESVPAHPWKREALYRKQAVEPLVEQEVLPARLPEAVPLVGVGCHQWQRVAGRLPAIVIGDPPGRCGRGISRRN